MPRKPVQVPYAHVYGGGWLQVKTARGERSMRVVAIVGAQSIGQVALIPSDRAEQTVKRVKHESRNELPNAAACR